MRLRHVMSIILLLSSVYASKIEFDRYTIDDGLSQNTVYKVFQDSRGYIWLGTQGGLDRFNGYEFKHYEHESNDSTSIVNGWIRAINEDEDGLLWLGTVGGNLGWFDPYDEIGGEIDLFANHPDFDRPGYIYDILFHGDYIFLTTLGSGLCRYNRKDGSILWYSSDSTSKHYIKDRVFTNVYSISKDKILLGDRSIIILNTETNEHVEPYNKLIEKEIGVPFDSIKVSSITQTSDRKILIGTWSDHGLIILDMEDESVSQFFPLPPDPDSGKVPRTMIGEITIDRFNKLWMPVFNVGLATFDMTKEEFELHLPDPKNPNSLSDSQIESIIMDKSGAIWLGSARSLMNHDSEKKKFNIISNSSNANIRSSFNEKWDLHIDSKDKLWAGSVYRGSGLDVIDMKTKSVTNHIPPNAKDGRGISMWRMAEDNDGRIWGLTQYGLFVSDKNKENFDKVFDRSNITFKETGAIRSMMLGVDKRFWIFSEKKTWWIEFDQDSIIWVDAASKKNNLKDVINIGGYGNRYKNNRDNDFYLFVKFGSVNTRLREQLLSVNHRNFKVDTLYDHGKAERKIPGFDAITHINQSKDGKYWFTTYGEGFTKFDITSREFEHYGINDGLPNSYLYCIYEDESGYLWMSSNFGIIRFDPKSKSFRQYGIADGIQNFEYNSDSHAQAKDGTLFFGGLSGTNYFNPNKLKDNPNEPMVLIESFSKSDSIFAVHKSDNSDEIYNIYYYEKDLSFNFAAIDFRNPSRNQHAYMMEGYDDYWHFSGTRRYASYTNLPSGDYVFRVKGSNNDQVWNDDGASLKIRIHPAPWETKWAYMVYFATTGFGIFGYIRRQRRLHAHAMEEQRREEELEEARQFQMDMLPDTTPDILDLDISATIQTASEVGGDYYDFFPENNNESLYVVVGDATGHGMTAGMMVSITKAGLYGIPSIPPNDVTERLNRVIKNIDLGWNRMAINIARFWEDKVEFTSAAMPPAYHYHADSGEVDEILIEGLPLGSLKDETFDLVQIDFNKGDSLIFISDGLPEATNVSNQMLGYEAVMDCVQANGKHSAEEQKQALLDLGTAWLGELRNQDDITIVVVKKT
ncbi:MAG: SpoIIE family protein phosphatase [Candidatus Neomarinimicrobiota bacterium]